MQTVDRSARRWSMIAGIIEDDARHRHANEFANALAGLHLVKATLGKPNAVVEDVIARLEAQVRLERHILQPMTENVADAVEELCTLMVASRGFLPGIALSATDPTLRSGTHALRSLLKIAHELIANAVKYSHGPNTPVFVTLTRHAGFFELVVRNRMPASVASPGGGGLGLLVSRRMAATLGGRLSTARDAKDHVARIRLPVQ